MQTVRIIILSALVALFGVASTVLGFVAEATKLKPADIGVTGSECVYPGNPAYVLALCAAFLLGVAQIIASAAGGCCGCCRPGTTGHRAPKSRLCSGIIASILAWIATVIAIVFYLQGALLNLPITHSAYGGDGQCFVLRSGVFTRAAVLSLVATALGILSHILLTSGPSAMAAAPAGYGPKPDGTYPPVVGMTQQGPYGQGQPAAAQGAPPAAAGAPGQGHAYANV